MGRPVSDSEVAAYFPLCKSLAARYTGHGGAEFDDLFQEGCIAVWQAIADGFTPSKVVVSNRMRNWVKQCRAKGFGDGRSDTELLD